jgi:hypothetical protein
MTSQAPVGELPSDALLRKAQDQYRTLAAALREAETRLAGSDNTEVKGIAELLRTHWKAFQTTLDLEIDLEKRNRERAGIVHGYALDLDVARAEVGRRLACLKTAGGSDAISGGPE